MKKTRNFNDKDLAIGTVFKNLRHAKGFSQKEAVGSEISCNHLSGFENGHTILASNHFLAVLQNINVNLYEFQNAYNEYLHSNDILLFSDQVAEAYAHRNTAQLKSILEKIDLSLQANPYLKKYKLDKIHVEVILSELDSSYTVSKQDIDYLKQYLLNLKEWGQNDIFLLGHCAPALDSYVLYELTNHLIKPTQSGTELHYVTA